jgi:hypothetical protein
MAYAKNGFNKKPRDCEPTGEKFFFQALPKNMARLSPNYPLCD